MFCLTLLMTSFTGSLGGHLLHKVITRELQCCLSVDQSGYCQVLSADKFERKVGVGVGVGFRTEWPMTNTHFLHSVSY